MTIDINYEIDGMRATLLIVTSNVETHSAFQEISKEDIESFKNQFRYTLEILLKQASLSAKK